MDTKALKTQMISDMSTKGCSDMTVCLDCISQAVEAKDMLSTYGEMLTFALSLYNARMWGRKKSNDSTQKEKQRREKLFSQPAACLSTPRKEPGPDEIRVGRLILRKKQ